MLSFTKCYISPNIITRIFCILGGDSVFADVPGAEESCSSAALCRHRQLCLWDPLHRLHQLSQRADCQGYCKVQRRFPCLSAWIARKQLLVDKSLSLSLENSGTSLYFALLSQWCSFSCTLSLFLSEPHTHLPRAVLSKRRLTIASEVNATVTSNQFSIYSPAFRFQDPF